MLINITKQNKAALRVEEAKSLLARLKGLLGKSNLSHDQTLWIPNCPSIHTFFMKFTIDAVFVDKKLVVKACYPNLVPWRFVPPVRGADSVFEFSAGSIKKNKIEVGDQLSVDH